MLSLVGYGALSQHKPNLNTYSNYTTNKMCPSKCSSLQHVVNNANYGSRKIEGYSSSKCTSLLRIAKADIGRNNSEEEFLKAGLQRGKMPKHVAIILDGSRRWLKSQGKPLSYEPFFEANSLFADLCLKWGVGTATTFIYSLKNLQRGQEANDLIFEQLESYLENNLEQFMRKEIRVSMIGDKCALPKSLQDMIETVEEGTRKGGTKQLDLMLAICYAGTRDIVEATRSISEKVRNGMIEPNAIDEALVDKELWTNGAPHPDLLIRTGGRVRVSDYMIWQMAQTELYFTNLCAPEFQEAEFLQALRFFHQSQRTFGK